MATVTLNGKPRKQLADQLDRLDGIIDALADGLNGAVADAARDGTHAAVKEVLIEVLADPEVLVLLRAALTPTPVPPFPAVEPAAPAPSKWAGVKSALRRAAVAVAAEATTVAAKSSELVRAAADRAAGLARAAAAKLSAPARRVRDAGRAVRAAAIEAPRVLRTAALVGIGVGAAVTVASTMNHSLAATVAGAASGVVAAAAHVGWAARGLARRLRLA